MKDKYMATSDHEEIRRWAESMGASPILLSNPHVVGGGTLSFRFPQSSLDSRAQEVSWGEFFEVFEERNLKLVYPVEPDNVFHFKFISRSHEP